LLSDIEGNSNDLDSFKNTIILCASLLIK